MKGQGKINVGKIRLFLENKFREETILGDPFFFYNYFVSPLFGWHKPFTATQKETLSHTHNKHTQCRGNIVGYNGRTTQLTYSLGLYCGWLWWVGGMIFYVKSSGRGGIKHGESRQQLMLNSKLQGGRKILPDCKL